MKKLSFIAQQTPHQWFNFWLLFFCQLSIELGNFYYSPNPLNHLPQFLLVRIMLIAGWHCFFILCSKAAFTLSRKLKKVINGLETGLTLTVFLFEGYLLRMYKTHLTDSLCIVILASNRQECQEFLNGIILNNLVVLSLFLLLLASLSIIITRYTLKYQSKLWVHCIFLFALVTMLSLSALRAKNCYMAKIPISTNSSCGIDRIIWNPQVANMIRIRIGRQINNMLSPQHLKTFQFKSPFKTSIDIVLILGETARADYLSAYGFPVKTSPKLDSLILTGDAFCFNDARTAANRTIFSGHRIFTFWNDAKGKEWSDFPDLISCFKKAGYKTKWFTNQETEGENSIERIFGKPAHELRTPHGTTGGVVAPIGYDEEILPVVKGYGGLETLENSHIGQFTVIHLMGSHYEYKARYPRNFKRFGAQDVPKKKGAVKDERVAEYMNSILYTDHILDALYAYYRERPALVIYLSDHGESLYDDHDLPDLCGHGGRACIEQADIPFVIMLTPSFRSTYPNLSKQLYDARYRPISTAWLTNTLTLTAGIRTKYSDEQYNFFGEKFSPHRTRKTEGEGGYFSYPAIKKRRVK